MQQAQASQVAFDALARVTLAKTGPQHLSLRLAAAIPHKRRLQRAVSEHLDAIATHARNAFAAGKRVLRGHSDGSLTHQDAEEVANRAVEAVQKAFARDLEELLITVASAGADATAKTLKTKVRIAAYREGLKALGGRGSGNFSHAGRKGEVGGSGEASSASSGTQDRAERARAAHNVFTKQKEAWATGNEKQMVQMVKGEGTDNNLPVDVIVRDGNKAYGIEVKTMLDNKAGKITMRKDALVRKTQWARKNHGSLHTVILDDRGKFGMPHLYSGHRVYYQKGVGSFRLSTMTKVRDGAHLAKLLRGKK